MSDGAIAVLSGAVPTAGLDNRGRAKIIDLVVKAAQNASRKLGAVTVGDPLRSVRRDTVATARRRYSAVS
jgi:hypothetical protein